MVLPQLQPTLGAYVNALFHRFDPPDPANQVPVRGSVNRRRSPPHQVLQPSPELFSSLASFCLDFPDFIPWCDEHRLEFSQDGKSVPKFPRSDVSPYLPLGFLLLNRRGLSWHDGEAWVRFVALTITELREAPLPPSGQLVWCWV